MLPNEDELENTIRICYTVQDEQALREEVEEVVEELWEESEAESTGLRSSIQANCKITFANNVDVSEYDPESGPKLHLKYVNLTEYPEPDVSIQDEHEAETCCNEGFTHCVTQTETLDKVSTVYDLFPTSRYKLPSTGVWNDYDILPDTRLLPIEPSSFQELISNLPRNTTVEDRVDVAGQEFRIVETFKKKWSLFKAVSNVITGSERRHKDVRKMVMREIRNGWDAYLLDIAAFCGWDSLQLRTGPDKLFSIFSKRFLSKPVGSPTFIFKAVANALRSDFVLFDINDFNEPAVATKFRTRADSNNNVPMTFFCLRVGMLPENRVYHALAPIRAIKSINPGIYELGRLKVIVVDGVGDNQRDVSRRRRCTQKISPEGNDFALCLGLGQERFLHRPTYTHDLWSLLSELLFQSITAAPQIFEMTKNLRLEESHHSYFLKLMKRKVFSGYGPDKKIRNRYLQSLKVSNGNGTTEDLQRASEILKFSYTLIGLDFNGNFFWKTSWAEKLPDEEANHHLNLFLKQMRAGKCQWFAMEEYSSTSKSTKGSVSVGDDANNNDSYSFSNPLIDTNLLKPFRRYQTFRMSLTAPVRKVLRKTYANIWKIQKALHPRRHPFEGAK